MTTEHHAPGLPADWLNGWLAAIGVTVLVPGTRLRWTSEPVPKAVFSAEDGTGIPDLVATHLPALEELNDLAIATLPQKISLSQYQEAARAARETGDLSLAVLTTDILGPDRDGSLPTGPFNVGVPRGETLFARLRACRDQLESAGEPVGQIDDSFAGRGARFVLNGLGFDYRRITASVPGEADKKMVDPVVECLSFFGLLLHPVSGDGKELRQRGWSRANREHPFRWPVWRDPLDRWAIDGLLDIAYGHSFDEGRLPTDWTRLGVTGVYGVVPFRPTGARDPTRGYAAERLV